MLPTLNLLCFDASFWFKLLLNHDGNSKLFGITAIIAHESERHPKVFGHS
jgi:hypothetical protein